jgi:hypothetical protein
MQIVLGVLALIEQLIAAYPRIKAAFVQDSALTDQQRADLTAAEERAFVTPAWRTDAQRAADPAPPAP